MTREAKGALKLKDEEIASIDSDIEAKLARIDWLNDVLAANEEPRGAA